ncbi:MAG: hypothetical protein ACRDAP_04860 [Shewanella sp.]
MSGLDSLYAMLAQPVTAQLQPKRIVDQVGGASANAADSHERPQSQLPPALHGRKRTFQDRRKRVDMTHNKRRRATDKVQATHTTAIAELTDDMAEMPPTQNGHIIDIEV